MNNASPLRRMVYASMFGALTAIGSLIAIPVQPIPITLQTMFTGLSGILLGGYAGALSQIVYILLGVIGLPVFAGGRAGLGTLLGPTGGYLIGFVLAAYIIGQIMVSRRQPGFLWTIMALLIGNLIIYVFGTAWLAFSAHLDPVKALLLGVVPFLPGDAVKLMAAAVLGQLMSKYFNSRDDYYDQDQ